MPEETDRLDSWKQIAAYLQKSERTVRRWHEVEGLPVHKHQHQQRGSVWAYPGEIDAWLDQRRVSPATVPLADEPEADGTPRWRHGLTAAAVTGVALALGAFWWFRPPPEPSAVMTLSKPIPLTSLPGVEFGPDFSPDGKQVVFFWGRPDDSAGIYSKEVGSETVTPLVLGGGHFVYAPAWSPDGKTIAYLRRTGKDETWLCLVAASGGPEKRLIRLQERLSGNHRHLSWSLDSRRILAPVGAPHQRAIHWISVADGAAQPVTEPMDSAHAPVASPDRRAFVFLRNLGKGEQQELLLQKLKPDGGSDGVPQLLFQGTGYTSGVAWTPGGQELVVCKAESGYRDSRLYRMKARPGGRLTPIDSSPEACSTVAVSGTRLAYGRSREANVQLWKAKLNDLEHAAAFAPSSRSDTFPAFSPNGELVAFRSTRGGAPAAWIANQDGTQPRRVTDLQPLDGSIEWSPDGNQILFGSAQVGLALVPLTGAAPSVLAVGSGLPGQPHWSHGSGLIYFVAAYRLFQIRPDGSGRTAVGDHRLPAYTALPKVRTSADGKTLFISSPEGLFRRPAVATGEAEELIEPKLFTLSLAATRTALYYFRREDKALYALPFAAGALPKKIGTLRPFNESIGFTISPDGGQIIWTGGHVHEIDLELVPDFR